MADGEHDIAIAFDTEDVDDCDPEWLGAFLTDLRMSLVKVRHLLQCGLYDRIRSVSAAIRLLSLEVCMKQMCVPLLRWTHGSFSWLVVSLVLAFSVSPIYSAVCCVLRRRVNM